MLCWDLPQEYKPFPLGNQQPISTKPSFVVPLHMMPYQTCRISLTVSWQFYFSFSQHVFIWSCWCNFVKDKWSHGVLGTHERCPHLLNGCWGSIVVPITTWFGSLFWRGEPSWKADEKCNSGEQTFQEGGLGQSGQMGLYGGWVPDEASILRSGAVAGLRIQTGCQGNEQKLTFWDPKKMAPILQIFFYKCIFSKGYILSSHPGIPGVTFMFLYQFVCRHQPQNLVHAITS